MMFDNPGFGPEAAKDTPTPSERTVRLFEQHQRMRRMYPDAPQIQGAAANRHGIIHWTQSVRPGTVHIPVDSETFQGAFDLEPIRKRTAKQRLDEVASKIAQDAVESYKLTGKVYFPKSIVRDIQVEFWRAGETITEDQLEQLAYSQIRPMAEKYAAAVLSRCERKYEANNKSLPLAI